MNTYERDRAEGMLQRIYDAARRSEDYRRRAVSAGGKPQKAAARAKAMYGQAYDRMVMEFNSRAHTPFGNDEDPF
ncbi:hypothetical protein ACR77U_12960 [Enterococcus faecium]|uniref:hypothetical protein n=1 Tax=Enterococcus faecium TaxID=1352 RepID=UPI003DA4B9DD